LASPRAHHARIVDQPDTRQDAKKRALVDRSGMPAATPRRTAPRWIHLGGTGSARQNRGARRWSCPFSGGRQ
jgi:hypothetical protein